MKKYLLILVVLLCSLNVAKGQGNTKYVLWFDDDSFVEALYFTQTDDKISVRTLFGQDVVYDMSDISRIMVMDARVVPDAGAAPNAEEISPEGTTKRGVVVTDQPASVIYTREKGFVSTPDVAAIALPAKAGQKATPVKYVIWFDNGGYIEGLSIEDGEESVKLKTFDGRLYSFDKNDIDMINTMGKYATVSRVEGNIIYTKEDGFIPPAPAAASLADPVLVVNTADSAPEPSKAQSGTIRGQVVVSGNYAQGVPYRVRSFKSPFLAGFLSFLIPGVGQFYNGDIGKGFGFLLGVLIPPLLAYATYSEGLLYVSMVTVPALWIWSICDAAISANKYNWQYGWHVGNNKYLNLQPSVLASNTFGAKKTNYHSGLALSLSF